MLFNYLRSEESKTIDEIPPLLKFDPLFEKIR